MRRHRNRHRPRRPGAAAAAGPRRRPGTVGLILLQVLVLAMFAGLTARMWYLQVPMAEHYKRLAEATHSQKLVVPATRGRILDSSGQALVRNRTELVVSADYHTLKSRDDGGESVLRRVAKVLDVPYDHLRKRMRLCGPEVTRPCWPGSPYQPITLADDVDPKLALKILERQERFPGISAQQQAVRDYPHGEMAAQMLGYLQPITQEELDAREQLRTYFTGVDRVGRDGLEAVYDDRLRGTAGTRQLAVNNHGEVTGVLEKTPPKPGMHLVTSIDTEVQAITEQALRRGMERRQKAGYPADSGAAVVMDVTNGQVVAMASKPSYDPSVWNGGIKPETFDRLLSEEAGKPLTSRALQGQYPPGSTFKVSSLLAGVKGGASLNGTYSCPGSISIGGRSFQNYEGGGHGSISLHRAIVVSCNTVFYQLGYNEWREDGGTDPVKNPDDVFAEMAKDFGFGSPTGIDLPHESGGRIPDREWKRKYWEATREESCRRAKEGYPEVAKEDPGRAAYLKKVAHEQCLDGDRWRAGDAVNFAIGQGDVLVTPLQLARAYAAIANGGTLWEPHVGKAFISADGSKVDPIEPEKAGELPVKDEHLRYLQKALTAVPKEGTARGAFDGFPQDQVSIAGKTGSATGRGHETSAWFASYAPADDPRFAVVVLIPEGGTGGTAAAPVAREIYEGIYGIAPKKQDDAKKQGEDAEKEPPREVEAALPDGEPPDRLPTVRPDGSIATLSE